MGNICGGEDKPKQQEQQQKNKQHPTEPVSASGVKPHTKPLPSLTARPAAVYKVYDADTITLKNAERASSDSDRVRFVGIDAPELKEKEFMAEEGTAWLKTWLVKDMDIVLEIDPTNEHDHYGRTLARVFAPDPDNEGSMVCVNDIILLKGFAAFYDPKGSSMGDELREHMLKLQGVAISRRVGIWSNFDLDAEVVKSANGNAYHLRSCEHMSEIRNLTVIKKSEALGLGLSACRTCHP